jgi:hypothetical protein
MDRMSDLRLAIPFPSTRATRVGPVQVLLTGAPLWICLRPHHGDAAVASELPSLIGRAARNLP